MAEKKSSLQENYTKESFEQILEQLPDPIFVTDAKGNILLSNSSTAYSLDISLGLLLKSNVRDLVDKGFYNLSNVMEVVEKKTVISSHIKTKLGIEYVSTSTPVIDNDGEVKLVVTIAKLQGLGTKPPFSNAEKLENEQRKREIDYLRSYVFNEDSIVAESKIMQKTLLTSHAVAQTDSTIVLYGETGTGKEVLAKYIHKHSKRNNEAFIVINCATLPENLVESELFGYEKGAFTGALNQGKTGLFAAANGGTLFLDEIAELPLPMQAKLLRVLETGAVRKIGGHVEHPTDFRLIAATHKDLKQMVDEGSFRYDLYYRLNVVPISISPLRERPEDIAALAYMFVDIFNKKYSTSFKLDAGTLESFKKYNWPGNVRELRNVIERNVIINMHTYNEDHLTTMPQLPGNNFIQYDYVKLLGLDGPLKEVMKTVEERYIRHVLDECDGKVGKAAEKLGIYRTVLYRKLKEFDKKQEEVNEND